MSILLIRTRTGSSSSRMLLALPHSALHPTFGIRALEVLQPAAGRHSTSHNILFFVFLEEQRRDKTNKKLASHCVKSQIGVSQPAVLCSCDCNHFRWAPCAKPDPIVLHSVKQHPNRSPDAIHPLAVTTRCRLVSRTTKFVLHSADRHPGGSVGSVSLVTAVIRSRIGLNNRFLVIGIRHTIRS